MRARLFLAAAVASLTLSACSIHINEPENSRSDWQAQEAHNRSEIGMLELGTPQSEVRANLGEPDFVEAFETGGKSYRILFYRTERRHGDGRTTMDETTPLVFVDGRLTGWGQRAYEQAGATPEPVVQ